MTSGQKIAFSLLLTMLLFAGFMLTVKNVVFNQIETRFYTQSKIRQNVEHLDSLAESSDIYITNILSLIETNDDAYMKAQAVRSFYMQNPSEKDVNERRRLTEELFKSIPSLDGLRIIDKNGRTVHFSTYDESDVLKQSGITKFYKYYNDIQKDADELPFETIARSSSESQARILFDESKNRLILSIPFFWIDELYSGLGLFYFDVKNIERALSVHGVLDVGETFSMFADEQMNGAFVTDVPAKVRSEIGQAFKKLWTTKKESHFSEITFPDKLLEMEDGRFWVCLTDSGKSSIRVSGVYTSDMFEITKEMELVIYISLFLTIFLLLFLIFSAFGEPVSKMKKRIKKIQYSLISDFIESKDKIEWENAVNQLRNSRADLSAQILKGFRVHSKKKRRELSEYLDGSWNEIIAAMESRLPSDSAPVVPVTAAGASDTLDQSMIIEMRRMMEKVLFEIRSSRAASAAPVEDVEELEDLDEVEEIEDAEPIDEVEELDDAEPVEDAEPIDEAEPVEEIEDAEPIEELDEVDEVEELDDVEDAEAIEAAEEIDEVEELDEVEDAEDVESLDEVDDAEEVDEAEEIEDAESVDEVEELDDAEPVEELDEVEDLDFVDKIEPSEASEPVDNEQLKSLFEPVENIEELNKIEDAEPADEEDFSGEMQMDELLEKLNSQNTPSFDTEELSLDDFLSLSDALNAEADNEVFKEELGLGIIKTDEKHYEVRSVISEFRVYKIDEEDDIEDSSFNHQTEEEIEELTEEVILPKEQNYFTMTTFTAESRFYGTDLPSAEADDTIVENNGVYSITDSLEYSDVVQDPAFKALVDSVLHQVSAL